MARLLDFDALISSERRLHRQRRMAMMASKQPGFKCTCLPCLGLDDGQIQPSEPTTEKYPGAEVTALLMIWDELPQEAIRQESCAIAKMTAQCAV